MLYLLYTELLQKKNNIEWLIGYLNVFSLFNRNEI